jgi:hypothetical protein
LKKLGYDRRWFAGTLQGDGAGRVLLAGGARVDMQVQAKAASSEKLKNVGSEIDPAEYAQPTLAFLRHYWASKRRGALLPGRSDIDPFEMTAHLGWILLVDVLPGMVDFRYRLIGTRVSQYFLRDCTGKTITESFGPCGPVAIKAILACYRKVARDRVPLRMFGSAGWLGKEFLDFDNILLPLARDGVTVDMILGAFTFDARTQALRHSLRSG